MAGNPKKQSDVAKINTVGAEHVLDLLAQGYTVRKLAEEVGVSLKSMSHWMSCTPERAGEVARARARGAHALADQALDLADGATVDTERVAKLQIDTRKWLASKWNSAEYGEQRPSLTVNIATAHLSDLRGLLVASEPQPQVLEVSDAKVLGDAPLQGDKPALSVSNLKKT